MATVLGIDCGNKQGNIGVTNCIATPGQKIGHIKLTPDWSAPATTDFNKAFWNNEIQQGRAIFFSGAFGVTTATGDPTTQTSSLQIQTVTTRALPLTTSIFQKGYEWHAGAFLNSGNNNASIAEIFQDGSIRLALSKDGQSVTGYQTGMYEVLTVEDATDQAAQQTRIMYQMTDLLQYNTQGIFLTNMDFNPNTEIYNILDVAMTGRADVSENKIYVKTPWLRNPNQSISGFAAANFRVEIDGVSDAIVGTVTLDSNTKEWAITPTATLGLTDEIQVFLTDQTATPPVDVARIGVNPARFYDGQTDVFTPTA